MRKSWQNIFKVMSKYKRINHCQRHSHYTHIPISLTLIIHSCQINNPLLSLFLVQTTTLCTLLCKYKSQCSFSLHYSSQPIFFLFHFLADIPYFNDQDQIKDSLYWNVVYTLPSHPSVHLSEKIVFPVNYTPLALSRITSDFLFCACAYRCRWVLL
jgi:hypothetical protein